MFTSDRIERIMRRKRLARQAAIEELRVQARSRGESDEPGLWTLIHDLERASPTTNLAQLAEIGVDMPVECALGEEELAGSLAEVVRGLAELDIYLRHTDHLDDRSLHRILRNSILIEPVRDLPSGIGCCEWIDLSGGADRSAYLTVHANDDLRHAANDRGQWVPGRLTPLADRDRDLPRPSRSSWPEGEPHS